MHFIDWAVLSALALVLTLGVVNEWLFPTKNKQQKRRLRERTRRRRTSR
mgnify:CR=1 FL=1